MSNKESFTHDDFIKMIRRAKQRKYEWEQRVGEKLEVLQREIDSKHSQYQILIINRGWRRQCCRHPYFSE